MEIPDYLAKFVQEVNEHMEKVAEKPNGDQLQQPFRVMNNRIVITQEVYGKYGWRLPEIRVLSEDELRIRFKYLFRDLLFVGTMSSLEYYAIKILSNTSDHPAAKYISRIGERNVHLKYLVKWIGDADLWMFAIALRNDIVHFDSVARQTIPAPQMEFPVIMKEGEQAEGLLRSFISLAWCLERSFYRFVMSLD